MSSFNRVSAWLVMSRRWMGIVAAEYAYVHAPGVSPKGNVVGPRLSCTEEKGPRNGTKTLDDPFGKMAFKAAGGGSKKSGGS